LRNKPQALVTPEVAKLPTWEGKAYRSETGYKHEKGDTAEDVANYEQKELGNKLGVTNAVLAELKNYPATDLVWVTKTKGAAGRYGTPADIALPQGSRIIGTDGEGGYLVLKQSVAIPQAEVGMPVTPEVTELYNQVKTWYRGSISPTTGDVFYSSSKEVAAEYAAPAKIGGEAGVIEELKAKPQNVYTATSKSDLAEQLGITVSQTSRSFDDAVKVKLQSQGYDAIYYSTGTFEADELHIFGKPTPTEVTQVPGMPEAGITEPRAEKGKAEAQARYKELMKPHLEAHDKEIKAVNDDFMAGKTSLAENQAQRDAINLELDKQANKIRKEMGFPEMELPTSKAPVTPEVTKSKVFYTTTTDMPLYDQMLDPTKAEYFAREKGEKGTIIWMTPDEALAKGAEIRGVSIEEELRIVNEEAISKYAGIMNRGEKFPLPILDYKRKDQEGRHRILAAKRVGETRIPVLVVEEVTELPNPGAEPIKHRGTEPEGIAIANELGVAYDGMWENREMSFTDVRQTGSSIAAFTLEEARTKLAKMRELFANPPAVGGNPVGKTIIREEAIGLLERLSMTPEEAARSLVADEVEREAIMRAVQERVKGEQNKWAPMDPREGPPLPRIFAGLRWPWSKS